VGENTDERTSLSLETTKTTQWPREFSGVPERFHNDSTTTTTATTTTRDRVASKERRDRLCVLRPLREKVRHSKRRPRDVDILLKFKVGFFLWSFPAARERDAARACGGETKPEANDALSRIGKKRGGGDFHAYGPAVDLSCTHRHDGTHRMPLGQRRSNLVFFVFGGVVVRALHERTDDG